MNGKIVEKIEKIQLVGFQESSVSFEHSQDSDELTKNSKSWIYVVA